MSARSADARRRLAGALLAALSVWPLVQIALAFGLDTSPELFGAWGSYAVPSRVPYLSIEATRGDRPWVTLGDLHPSLHAGVRRYMNARVDTGRLWSADDLADDVFAAYPDLDRLVIHFDEGRLDRATGHVLERSFEYPYDRPPRDR